MLKKILCLALAAVLCCTPVLAAPAPTHTVNAKAAILYEVNTDTILMEQDADMKLFPASTTYLLNGEQISFMDLMRYLLIGSGNDAANALAIHVSGSVEGFVDLMNNKAQELGMTNTHFVNPHGLHNEEHYTSARDLLTLTKVVMENEIIADLVAQDELVLPVTNKHDRTTTKYTTNHLLTNKSTGEYYYEGAIGIKTGTTTPAGLCLVAGCVKGDYTYYSVVLGCEKMEGRSLQFEETIKLFNWGAATWSQQVMLSSSQPIADVPVRLGDEKDTVVVRPAENITAMLPNTFETDDLEMDYTLAEDVVAPVKAGELTVRYEDKEYQLDLVAADDVERSTMLYVLDRVTAFFTSTTFKIIVAAIVALIAILVAYAILINRKRAKRRKNRRR